METSEDIYPKLSKINKVQPFRTPDHYFDSLISRVQDKIATEKEISFFEKVLSKLNLQITLVISISIFIIITYIGVKMISSDKSISQNTDLVSMIDNHIYSFDDYTLMNEMDDQMSNTLQNNDTINFLVNDNIDESLLSNEY
jgi:hypothetical protein